jgi:hypothetical protein
MTVQQSLKDRFRGLVEEATRLLSDSRRGDSMHTDEAYENECRGWMVSAEHAVELVCRNSANTYLNRTREICGVKLHSFDQWSNYIAPLNEIIKRLLVDIDAGLIASIANSASAETLDNLLDQAQEYHVKSHTEGAGILSTAVFEDTVRRIARVHNIHDAGAKMDSIITDLDKKGVITPILAKRCRAAAGVRNAALHAQWNAVKLDDVDSVIRLTRQLLSDHLSG